MRYVAQLDPEKKTVISQNKQISYYKWTCTTGTWPYKQVKPLWLKYTEPKPCSRLGSWWVVQGNLHIDVRFNLGVLIRGWFHNFQGRHILVIGITGVQGFVCWILMTKLTRCWSMFYNPWNWKRHEHMPSQTEAGLPMIPISMCSFLSCEHVRGKYHFPLLDLHGHFGEFSPRCWMYGLFTYIWVDSGVNIGTITTPCIEHLSIIHIIKLYVYTLRLYTNNSKSLYTDFKGWLQKTFAQIFLSTSFPMSRCTCSKISMLFWCCLRFGFSIDAVHGDLNIQLRWFCRLEEKLNIFPKWWFHTMSSLLWKKQSTITLNTSQVKSGAVPRCSENNGMEESLLHGFPNILSTTRYQRHAYLHVCQR